MEDQFPYSFYSVGQWDRFSYLKQGSTLKIGVHKLEDVERHLHPRQAIQTKSESCWISGEDEIFASICAAWMHRGSCEVALRNNSLQLCCVLHSLLVCPLLLPRDREGDIIEGDDRIPFFIIP